MTFAEILEKIDNLGSLSDAELSAALYELSDIIMGYAILPKQAEQMVQHFHAAIPASSKAWDISDKVPIETGAGESLAMLSSAAYLDLDDWLAKDLN